MIRTGVNDLELCSVRGRECVKKTYSERLKGYDVYWPLSRSAVEAGLLKMLRELTEGNCAVHIPELISYDRERTLILEYCDGQTLADILEKPSVPEKDNLPADRDWRKLFDVLMQVANIPYAKIPDAVMRAINAQNPIVECMYTWKLQGRSDPPHPERQCLCLGDMSINNILWDERRRRWVLLDFECGHWGSEGYDAGQLLGMLEAKDRGSLFYPEALQAFSETALEKAVRENCKYWKERFLAYYRNGA